MNNQQLPTSTQRIRQFVRSHLFLPMNVVIAGNVLFLGLAAANIWNAYQEFRHTLEQQLEMEKRSSEVKYLGEFLTASARMAATTGNSQWEKRYNNTARLNASIEYILDNSDDVIRTQVQRTAQAKDKLFKMESDTFALVRKGKIEAAQSLLFSPQYDQQKTIYATGNNLVFAQAEKIIQKKLDDYQQQLLISIGLMVGILPVLLGSWILVRLAVRNYIRDQQFATKNWQVSQNHLLAAQGALEEETQQLQHQKQIVQQDHEQLQQDVDELLGMLNEIKSGNLTRQAPVHDRPIGLMANSINQLIKDLSKTLHQVITISNQLDGVVQSHRDITMIVTDNIDRQTQSVEKIWRLIKAIRQLAQSTVQQSAHASQSLVVLQSAVADGQYTITTLSQDIDMLEVGSDRIVQEVKTLAEFVGLTDKFVQDQGEIVTQTTILAINAALVASRAAEQRDPTQFMIVAREFELIANQVSQLAQKTNEGLTSLEQRSSQIHRVVSAVNTDVQKLGTVVNSFTQGVKHTQEIFLQVQSVTEQSVKFGKNIAITSRKIVDDANTTVVDIESIITLASQTLQYSKNTQQLGDQLNILTQDLLDNVRVFTLSESTTKTENTTHSQLKAVELTP